MYCSKVKKQLNEVKVMASPFEALDAALQAVIDARFGDAILITPRKNTVASGHVANYSVPAVDAGRQPVSTVGILSIAPKTNDIAGQRRGIDAQGTTRFQTGDDELWISAQAYDAIGYELQKGDLITCTGIAGQPRYSVAYVNRPGMGDVQIPLIAERGGQ